MKRAIASNPRAHTAALLSRRCSATLALNRPPPPSAQQSPPQSALARPHRLNGNDAAVSWDAEVFEALTREAHEVRATSPHAFERTDSDATQSATDEVVTTAFIRSAVPWSPGYRSHISAKAQKLFQDVSSLNIKYDRGGKGGEGLLDVPQILSTLDAHPDYPRFYSEKDRSALLEASDAVQQRMRIKVSMQYMDHALRIPKNANSPHPILDIVLPVVDEVDDVAGEADPSNQNRYSPLDGLLHKYEMLLGYMSINCSSHCRYCYRSDLFNGVSDKSRANVDQIALYTRRYNYLIENAIQASGVRDPESGLMIHEETGETLLPIREILFSGGDPLTLPNQSLLRYMVLMAESSIRTIRFGTKEFIFNPARFDAAFFGMLDAFHEAYPESPRKRKFWKKKGRCV